MNESIAPWQIFGIIGVLLMISEIFVPGFVMLPIGLAFIATAVASLFISNWAALLVLLALFLTVVFVVVKRRKKSIGMQTGAGAMIGAECIVTEAIAVGGSGYVKLYGDRWQALADSQEELIVGQRAIIVRLDGNKVIVKPLR